jgi:hypothetical protein
MGMKPEPGLEQTLPRRSRNPWCEDVNYRTGARKTSREAERTDTASMERWIERIGRDDENPERIHVSRC